MEPGYKVMTVNATDRDSGVNAQLRYSMSLSPLDGFYIDENTGNLSHCLIITATTNSIIVIIKCLYQNDD